MKPFFVNELRRLGSDIFNVHATFGRGHHHRKPLGSIDHDAQIKFAVNIATRFNKHVVDHLPFWAGLDGDQGIFEHGLSHSLGLRGSSLGLCNSGAGLGLSSLGLGLGGSRSKVYGRELIFSWRFLLSVWTREMPSG